MHITLFDSSTAIALAQILPVLLLALMVELRRTELHRRGRSPKRTRMILALFFGAFAVVETILVLSIDGHLLPTRLSDLAAAAIIFGLLWLLFVLSLVGERETEKGQRHEDAAERRRQRAKNDGL
jgi:LytS/YehU family sensor histidine kinase